MSTYKSYSIRLDLRLNSLLIPILMWTISRNVSAANKINFYEEKLVGYFTSSDLSVIFDGLNENPSEEIFDNIFETFPRLLVPFEQVTKNARQTSPERQILDKAAKLNYDNRNLNDITTKPIDIWMSFFPNKNIINDATTILRIAFQANSIYKGTVSTILLQYPDQGLTPLSLPLIKQDILKTADLIRTYPEDNLSFGVVLDLKNCQQNVERISQLPTKELDFLFFNVDKVPQIRDHGYHGALIHLSEGYENCRKKAVEQIDPKRTNLGFISRWPIRINQTDRVSVTMPNEHVLHSLRRWHTDNNATVVLEGFFVNYVAKKTAATGNSSSSKDKLGIEWLRKPTLFNKQQIRIFIRNQSVDFHRNSKFLPITNRNFRKLLMGDVTHEPKDYKRLQQLVAQIAEFKMDIVRRGGGDSNYEDQIPMQALISVDVSKQDVKVNKKAIENAFVICKFGNDIYPETVKAVVLNYEGYNVDKEFLISYKEQKFWLGFIAPNIKYASQEIKPQSSETKLGIVLPVSFCSRFLQGNAEANNDSSSELALVNLIIYKISLSMADIQAGVEEQIAHVQTIFERCRRRTEDAQHIIGQTNTEFQIRTTGCDGNFTDLKQIANFVKFWESINVLATKEKMVIIMDTAFDEPLSRDYCGWWRVLENTIFDKNSAEDRFVIENKKTTTLKLYEKLHPGIISQRESFGVTTKHLLLAILIPVIIFVIILTASAFYLINRYRSKYILGQQEIQDFFEGTVECIEDVELSPCDDGNTTAHSQPYNKQRYELSKHCFNIDFTRKLGSGEFGMVCRGTIKRENVDVDVAVKMINDRKLGSINGSNNAVKGLLSEIKILSHIGAHKHIIALEGAYTSELRTGKVYVFLELCQMGSLEKHLRSYKSGPINTDCKIEFANHDSSVGERYVNLVERKNILDDAIAHDLLRWSREICSGMEYLASKHVVHADLATRNILLDSQKCAKIADFGLSRRLYDYTNYVKTKQEPLPWRWMAPEALRRLEFNEKTDVWAFGITLWEICSLADQPYPGLSWDVNFPILLENGLRCGTPFYKEKGIYDIMIKCWDINPARRPSFSELDAELVMKTNYENVDIIAPQLN